MGAPKDTRQERDLMKPGRGAPCIAKGLQDADSNVGRELLYLTQGGGNSQVSNAVSMRGKEGSHASSTDSTKLVRMVSR